jgi:hypothetical protein
MPLSFQHVKMAGTFQVLIERESPFRARLTVSAAAVIIGEIARPAAIFLERRSQVVLFNV